MLDIGNWPPPQKDGVLAPVPPPPLFRPRPLRVFGDAGARKHAQLEAILEAAFHCQTLLPLGDSGGGLVQ